MLISFQALPDISWFSFTDVQSMAEASLQGLEPLHFFKMLIQPSVSSSSCCSDYSEYTVNDAVISSLHEIDNIPKSSYDQLLKSAGFSVEGLY